MFLDSNLMIRNFTPAAADLFRIQEIDKGRPLADLALRLDYPGFEAVLRAALADGTSHEADVPATDSDTHYRVTTRPYDKLRGDEAGLVVTATDVTELVRLKAELAAALPVKRRRRSATRASQV